ncbi:hypothetical protein M0R45_005241 [Rubus argutus]|uniref:Uncharacterized protein n=1 Tax=Rubus argutus TaxID=59490 RepID=A0AAW1YMA8_RUBAR
MGTTSVEDWERRRSWRRLRQVRRNLAGHAARQRSWAMATEEQRQWTDLNGLGVRMEAATTTEAAQRRLCVADWSGSGGFGGRRRRSNGRERRRDRRRLDFGLGSRRQHLVRDVSERDVWASLICDGRERREPS